MLTVRNMRPKPEPKIDKTLVWVGGMIILAFVLWVVGSRTMGTRETEVPVPVKPVPATK